MGNDNEEKGILIQDDEHFESRDELPLGCWAHIASDEGDPYVE